MILSLTSISIQFQFSNGCLVTSSTKLCIFRKYFGWISMGSASRHFQALPGDDFRHSSRLKNFFQNIVFNTGFPNLSLMIKILTLIRWKSSFSSFVQKKAGGRGREREPAGVFKRVFKKVFQKRAPA